MEGHRLCEMDGPSRLFSRPGEAGEARAGGGTYELVDGALLQVPPVAADGDPRPLVVLFHGAGSSARAGLSLLAAAADEAGAILLAPQSAGSTWDVIERGFGPDVRRIDDVLASVFATCAIDASKVAFGGFSDGASYALSVGLDNGDLARHIVAFSPGFAAPAGPRGRPRILVTHGIHDAVLPIGRCSRRLVPRLREAGYDVTYEEFDGGHVVTPGHGRRALAWLEGA
jgi:phospholipase/carboxylesterase